MSKTQSPVIPAQTARGSLLEVLLVFLKLGLTSFGGPVAHLGYFRAEFVERRKWLDDTSFSDLVALCQFLPGPASSQVGMALGLGRAGWAGALAAWAAFTLPSAVALIVFAFSVEQWGALARSGAVHGLKIAAVAVVAQAVWGMARSHCPDRLRCGIGIGATMLVLTVSSGAGQIAALVLGGLIGWRFLALQHLPPLAHRRYGVSRTTGAILLGVFAILLFGLPTVAALSGSRAMTAIADFYRAGALVFGGGHVVLPLLQAAVVPSGAVSNDMFMAGYGAAQAVPGPLFTFAAYLGAVMPAPAGGWHGGLMLLLAIFLPSFLLVAGVLPYWENVRQRAGIQQAMGGVNAAVVGMLGGALYDPVWTGAIWSKADFCLALAAYGALVVGKVPPAVVVALAAVAGVLMRA